MLKVCPANRCSQVFAFFFEKKLYTVLVSNLSALVRNGNSTNGVCRLRNVPVYRISAFLHCRFVKLCDAVHHKLGAIGRVCSPPLPFSDSLVHCLVVVSKVHFVFGK